VWPRAVENVAKASRGALWRLSGSVSAELPLRAWPRALGRIHGLSVPQRVRPYPAPTPASPSNINILLELLDRVADVAGAIAECGVYRGATLVALALHLRQKRRRRIVYGFDSFEGFGESIVLDLKYERTLVDPSMKAGGFSDTSFELVAQKSAAFGLSNVRLIKGYFETSLALCPETAFSFVHLDCDTYSAYRDCLNYFYGRLTPGAIVVFDEYDDPAWPGCNLAVDEFLSDKPERVTGICRDNFVKSYIVKR
jgi:O-methyltransferase